MAPLRVHLSGSKYNSGLQPDMSNEPPDQKCNKCDMTQEGRTDCEDVNLYEIRGDTLCQSHAWSVLEALEYKLIHSPNRPTSITEQRLLDETRMWKLQVKSGKKIS